MYVITRKLGQNASIALHRISLRYNANMEEGATDAKNVKPWVKVVAQSAITMHSAVIVSSVVALQSVSI